jgi:hypothetical protein
MVVADIYVRSPPLVTGLARAIPGDVLPLDGKPRKW